jgi:hypothetical protein
VQQIHGNLSLDAPSSVMIALIVHHHLDWIASLSPMFWSWSSPSKLLIS